MEELDRRDQRGQEKDTTPVTTSVRISPATKSQFNELVKTLEFDNQDQLLNYLLRLHDTNQIKAGLPGRETEIESFESYLNELFEIYKGSLRTCQDAELRIREKFEGNLKSNSETIQNLQSQLTEALATASFLTSEKAKLEENLTACKNEIVQIRKDRDTADQRCTEYKEKNDTLINTVREYEEDHRRVGKLNQELMQSHSHVNSLENLAEESARKVEHLEQENKKLSAAMEKMQKEAEELGNELAELKEEYRQKMFEKDQEKAHVLLEAREKYAEQLEAERKKSREEYAALLGQLKSAQPVMYARPENTP